MLHLRSALLRIHAVVLVCQHHNDRPHGCGVDCTLVCTFAVGVIARVHDEPHLPEHRRGIIDVLSSSVRLFLVHGILHRSSGLRLRPGRPWLQHVHVLPERIPFRDQRGTFCDEPLGIPHCSRTNDHDSGGTSSGEHVVLRVHWVLGGLRCQRRDDSFVPRRREPLSDCDTPRDQGMGDLLLFNVQAPNLFGRMFPLTRKLTETVG